MTLSKSIIAATLILLLAGCGGNGSVTAPAPQETLLEARAAFKTELIRRLSGGTPVETPPRNIFQVVKYDSAVGKLAAYVSPDPQDGKKHPAIIWITGGDCNTIDSVWGSPPRSDDQTAAAYRRAGIIMMFPSLRGGNDNPGVKESFLGEVDDVIAAGEFLRALPYVDPQRIYLGGHSTGGTLVLLVAECSDRFRAVFSFGPVDEIAGYGADFGWPFSFQRADELNVRSPGRWLSSIRSETFVIEGTGGNTQCLTSMSELSSNPRIHFLPVRGASHFSVLAPANDLIAKRILADTGAETNIKLTSNELSAQFGQ